MLRKYSKHLICSFSIVYVLCSFSCTLLKPLPLKPAYFNDSLQNLNQPDLSVFNGNYQICSTDTNYKTLAYSFFYSTYFGTQNLPDTNDWISLKVADQRHLKASLFVNGKETKVKTIKGVYRNNYFQFSTSHLKLKLLFLIPVYLQQTNRLFISEKRDLLLDNNSGGIGFLLILPIPLSGSSYDTYNLQFKRIE